MGRAAGLSPYNERERQKQLTQHRTTGKGHGRLITRHLQASSRLGGQLGWPGLKQVCRIERVTRKPGQPPTTEIAYAITSLSPERASAKALLSYNRGHWGIENRLRWVRDVTLGEDKCRANVGHSPHNLAALRNLSLSLLRLSGIESVAYALRDFASRPYDLLRFLSILNN